MTDLRKAAEKALEALDYEAREEPESIWIAEREALRQALDDKPPVKSYCGGKPNYCTTQDNMQVTTQVTGDVDAVNMSEECVHKSDKREQEPVAWMYEWGGRTNFTTTDQLFVEAVYPHFVKSTPLYAAPPISDREWVGLTDEEIMDRWPCETRIEFARWVEAKLQEKNT